MTDESSSSLAPEVRYRLLHQTPLSPPSAASSSTASSPAPPPPLLASSSSTSTPPSASLSSPPYHYSTQQARQRQMYQTPPQTARGVSVGSGRGMAREDSLGESFLALNSDSPPLGASTSATHVRGGEQVSDVNLLAAAGKVSSATAMQQTPSQQIAQRRQRAHAVDSDLQSAATEGEAFEDSDGAETSSPRLRQSTRGIRLGRQLGALKASPLSSSSASVASLAPSKTAFESPEAHASQRLDPVDSHGKISTTTESIVQAHPDLLNKQERDAINTQPLLARVNEAAVNRSHIQQSFVPAVTSDLVQTSSVRHQSHENENEVRVPQAEVLASQTAPQSSNTTTKLPGADGAKAKVGQLSDGDIVQLGATPGMDPSSLLNADGAPLSSKNILTIALQKAQSAVLLDSSNNVSEAITAYRQAVRLLQEVMERVSPKLGSSASSTTRQTSRRHNREEERRRLKVIHDTYADRIRLLSMINAPDTEEESSRTDESEFLFADAGDSTMGSDNLEALPTGAQNIARTEPLAADNGALAHQRQGPIISISRETNGRMTPVDHREGADDRNEERRIEDELLTPTTPYFDVDPLLGSHDDTYTAGIHAEDEPPTPRHTTLLDAPAMAVSASAQSAPSTYNRRNPQTVITQRSQYQEPSEAAPYAPQSTLPVVARVHANGGGATLVSPTTSSGSISQRRKNSSAAAASAHTAAISSSDPIDGHRGAYVASTTPIVSVPAEHASSSPSSTGVTFGDERKPHGALATDRSADVFDVRGSARSPSFSGRKRALSQPGNRRPSIPASFLAAAGRLAGGSANATSAGQQQPSPPPVPPLMPAISRKPSMPLTLFPQQSTSVNGSSASSNDVVQPHLTIRGLAPGRPLPSPSPSTYSGYHTLGTPMAMSFPLSNGSNLTADEGLSGEKAAIMNDLFPSALPSLQLGMPPSFASNASALSLPWLGVANALPESDKVALSDALSPSRRTLRPFYTMRQLHASIERGAFVTDRLYVPREVWCQSGSRLLAVETKLRMIELVAASLDGLDQAGQFLLHDTMSHLSGSISVRVARFVKQLDEVEIVMGEVQTTLAKKLGFMEGGNGVEFPHNASVANGAIGGTNAAHSAKRSNMHTFNSLSSKLQRSLNQMVTHNSKNAVDTPVAYVDALARLFVRAQVLGDHLSALLLSHKQPQEHNADGGTSEGYAALSAELRIPIEQRLKRFSKFFANVVLRFVLRDVAILVDKSVKRNAALLVE